MDGRPSAALRERAGSLTQWIKSRPLYDRLYALYENSRWSTREIEPFIRKYHIDMAEFEPLRYRSFAEFFDRRFRPGVRTFPSAPEEMGAFAEARYLGWKKVKPDQTFPVKGHSLSAEQILGRAERARPFRDGPVLLVRLAPVDYHHMHYPDRNAHPSWGLRGGKRTAFLARDTNGLIDGPARSESGSMYIEANWRERPVKKDRSALQRRGRPARGQYCAAAD